MNRAAGVEPLLTREAGLFRQRLLAVQRQQRDLNASRLCQASHHVAVAAVITVAAENQPVLAFRILDARKLKSRFARTTHQFIQRQPKGIRRFFFRSS